METTAKAYYIIVSPNFHSLDVELTDLRSELMGLVLERNDLMFRKTRELEDLYMIKLGFLEYELSALQCKILRIKFKLDLIQIRMDFKEPIDLSEIDYQMEIQYEQLEKRQKEWKEQIEEAKARSGTSELSLEESLELRRVYRNIMKILHPDICSNSSAEHLQLFQSVIDAYKSEDLDSLKIIAATLDSLEADAGNFNYGKAGEDLLTSMKNKKEELRTKCKDVKKKIRSIRSEFPFNQEKLLMNPERLRNKQNKIKQSIKENQLKLKQYTKLLKQREQEALEMNIKLHAGKSA
ncbi:MAG: hypothetical protein E7A81_03125 [Clostridiales bacterium]|nr:hypothetical protein [Clostridiales bacterium]MDU1042311.1 hypothetical protein [Clostridiales bacterium]